jgi:hypothetical protein
MAAAKAKVPRMTAAERDIDAPYMARTNGQPLAAVVAASIGTFALGALTTLNEMSTAVHDFLDLYAPVGPLSGKTLVAVAVWALAWIVLGLMWRGKEIDFRKAVIVSAVLIGLGLVGTYPSFFEQFATE